VVATLTLEIEAVGLGVARSAGLETLIEGGDEHVGVELSEDDVECEMHEIIHRCEADKIHDCNDASEKTGIQSPNDQACQNTVGLLEASL